MTQISRRKFIQNTFVVSLATWLPLPSIAYSYKSDAADGLLRFSNEGQIHLYSGVGHCQIYSNEFVLDIITDILKCKRSQVLIETGDNPDQLPIFLQQYSTHLSFSSKATNRIAVQIFKKLILKSAVSKFGGAPDDYKLENGFVYKGKREITFQEVVSQIHYVESNVSQKTRKLISSLDQDGIIVAVGDVT